VAFYDAVAEEHAMGKAYLTDAYDGFDAVEAFQEMIQRLSQTGPAGTPNSVGNDVRDYLGVRLLRQIGAEFEGFMGLPKRERIEGRYFLRALMLKALELARPELDEATREDMVAPPRHDVGPSYHVRKLADVAEGVLRRFPPEREEELLFSLLRKMDLHPNYHDVLLPQARQLCQDETLEWGDNQRALLSDLRALVPANAHAASSDPAGVRARLNRFDYMRRTSSDDRQQLGYLVGVLMRLDRLDEYEELVGRVIELGDTSTAALVEIAEQIDSTETHRKRIRDAAARALKAVISGAARSA
jgi:hypothetical protein